MAIRILHTYKIYKQDLVGGVAEAISNIVSAEQPDFLHSILVAREFGSSMTFQEDNASVRAVGSFGTFWSMPVAPSYPFVLRGAMGAANVMVHHAPFPLADLGINLPNKKRPSLIVHWHADIVRSSFTIAAIAPLIRQTLRRAHSIVVSHFSNVENSHFLREFAKKCRIVPYGIDFEFWSSMTEAERQEARRIRNLYPRLVVSTGRLVPYKGHDVLLRAMKSVDATLAIVGSGPLEKLLRTQSEKMEVTSKVLFAGFQQQTALKAFLHAARAFVLPSVTAAESFGIAQLEAMATGLPIINTLLPTAVPHVARHGHEAITVPPGDPTALAAALRQLLDHPPHALALGAAARSRAQEEFNRQLFVERLGQIYKEAARDNL